MNFKTSLAALALAASSSAFAGVNTDVIAGAKRHPDTVAVAGVWIAWRHVDEMTDKVECHISSAEDIGNDRVPVVATLKHNALFFDMDGHGGVESFSYRIDSQPKVDGKPNGSFVQLPIPMNGRKLLIQVITQLHDVKTYNIDLTGLAEVVSTARTSPRCK